jgi:hypothetical protein
MNIILAEKFQPIGYQMLYRDGIGFDQLLPVKTIP